MEFKKKSPCKNCPYRIDAPLKLWRVEEFKDLAAKDQSQFGAVYGCHKKDDSVCIGWLMDQDKRHFPSIQLRLVLSQKEINRTYLDALKSPSPLYKNIATMCKANYPEEF